MLPVPRLNFGSIDAVSYRQRDQKAFLQQMLHKEHYLDEIIRPSKFFLIGEKGTGKTSYAVYLENSTYENTRAKVVELNSTDYQKFYRLKQDGKLRISSYSDIWRVVLLHLLSHSVNSIASESLFSFGKFTSLRDAIDEYYQGAFKPEVDYSLELVENSETVLGLMAEHAKLGSKDKSTETSKSTSFQISLFRLQKQFEDALSSLKLKQSITLFIDGIDIRPEEIGFSDYIECIKGLANATWQLNTELLANIKDSSGRLKICLLMRPDILDQVGFQNLNAKVRDNGVVLNWQTSYDSFQGSAIFRMVSGILARQQENLEDPALAWKHYFPYQLQNQRISEKFDDPFIGILRYSFYRPRDIIQYLILMQQYVNTFQTNKDYFTEDSFHKCEKEYSEYLLGEVRDYLFFYYGAVDFDQIVGFFSMFGGKNSFSWEEFRRAFAQYKTIIDLSETTVDELKGGSGEFLQFLYSLNIIGYLEPEEFGGAFVHWCFRDRTPVKLRPRVKTGLTYMVHPGLARSLLVGRGGMSVTTAPSEKSATRRRRRKKNRKNAGSAPAASEIRK